MQLHWDGHGNTECEVTSCLGDNNRVDTKMPIQHLPTLHIQKTSQHQHSRT
jgi:hypothetical protein